MLLHLLLHFEAFVVSALVELFPGQAPSILPVVLANAKQIPLGTYDITCTLITTNSRQHSNNQPAKATIKSCYGDGAVSMLLTTSSKLNCAYYTLLYY
jgi:hypothetical protein